MNFLAVLFVSVIGMISYSNNAFSADAHINVTGPINGNLNVIKAPQYPTLHVIPVLITPAPTVMAPLATAVYPASPNAGNVNVQH